jgi:glycerate 2-kinase
MSAALVEEVRAIYSRAIAKVRADAAVAAAFNDVSGNVVTICGDRFALPDEGVYLIAIGKAALGMADAAVQALGPHVRGAIAVTKDEHLRGTPGVQVLRGAHPVPDDRSLAAGAAVAEFATRVPSGALVLCLISGGGSALVEDLRAGVTLNELRDTTQVLLAAGASIRELNAVRSRMSRLKAGGLLRLLAHTHVVNMIVSDVLGDDLHAIASGPTVPAAQHIRAEDVLERYGVQATLPEVCYVLDSTRQPPTFVIANISTAIDAAAAEARERGFVPVVLTRSVDGEARDVGRFVASIAGDTSLGRTGFGPATCLLAGGETVVTLRGDGVGGRNTEAALAAAIRLTGAERVAIGFLATDGDDGVSGVAGAIVTGETVVPSMLSSAQAALARNDSYSFLNQRGAAWKTGPSGTNVNDLVIVLLG